MSLDINQFAQSLKTAIVEGLAGARSATAPKNYVQAPEAYDGSRAGYETFRRNLELYVQAIPKDRDRILAALGFLTKDDADAWARNWTHDHDVRTTTTTWEEFLHELDEKFLDPRIAEYAREKIAHLRQGRDAADVFFLKFDELRAKAGFIVPEYHDVILVDYLRRALRSALVLAVMQTHEQHRATRNAIAETLIASSALTEDQAKKVRENVAAQALKNITYKEFRAYALDQDPVIRRHGDADHAPAPSRPAPRVFSSAPTYTPPPPPAAPAVAPTTSATFAGHAQRAPAPAAPAAQVPRDPDPMDVDRHRARAFGLCYRCKKPGHIARDCKETDLREVIRGLTIDDLYEISKIVAGRSTAVEGALEEDRVEVAEDNEDQDFVVPQ